FAKLTGEKEIQLDSKEVIAVDRQEGNMLPGNSNFNDQSITLADGTEKSVTEDTSAKPGVLPDMDAYFIVSSDVYDQLPDPEITQNYVAWEVTEGSEDAVIDAGHELFEKHPGVMAVDATVYDTNVI